MAKTVKHGPKWGRKVGHVYGRFNCNTKSARATGGGVQMTNGKPAPVVPLAIIKWVYRPGVVTLVKAS